MAEAIRLGIFDTAGSEYRPPPGPARPTGPVGPSDPVGPSGLPGATRAHLVSNRDRYPQHGLIDFRRIDAIGPTRLVAFDAELLTKCREWIGGSVRLAPLIKEINEFFAEYDIHITNTAGYAAVIRSPGLTIAARINYVVAMCVMSPGLLVPGSNEALQYWMTVYLTTLVDVLCYRGLQDDMVFP